MTRHEASQEWGAVRGLRGQSRLPASLVVRRLYRILPDGEAERNGLVRIIDESGEDHLYPKKLFVAIDLPSALTKRFAAAN